MRRCATAAGASCSCCRCSRSRSPWSSGTARSGATSRTRSHSCAGSGSRPRSRSTSSRCVRVRTHGRRRSGSRSRRRTRASGSSSPRSRSGCSRTRCCRDASESSRESRSSAASVPGRRGATATLVGSVFAHRMFDLVPGGAARRLGARDGEDPALGDHLDRDRARRRRRCCSSPRSCWRGATIETRWRVSVRCARSSSVRAGARRHADADRRRDRRDVPDLGWACQLFAVWASMRAFHIYESLSAAGLVLVLINVATIFPLWPGNFGLVQIAIALPLVNYGVPYAQGRRLRRRPAGDRGERRRRRRSGLPRARRHLLRDAQKQMDEDEKETESDEVLASPASLKGVLTPCEAAALLASGMRRVDGVEAIEAPVADGGEGMAEVIHTALGGEWRTAVVADPLGRAVDRAVAVLDDGTAVIDAAEAVGLPAAPERARPLHATSRGPRRAAARSAGRAADSDARRARRHRRPWTAGSACAACSASDARTCRCASRATCAIRCSASVERRASSGRRRGRRPTTSKSSSCGSPPWTSSRPTATCRVRAPAEGSAPRLRRWAPSSSTAQSSSST